MSVASDTELVAQCARNLIECLKHDYAFTDKFTPFVEVVWRAIESGAVRPERALLKREFAESQDGQWPTDEIESTVSVYEEGGHAARSLLATVGRDCAWILERAIESSVFLVNDSLLVELACGLTSDSQFEHLLSLLQSDDQREVWLQPLASFRARLKLTRDAPAFAPQLP